MVSGIRTQSPPMAKAGATTQAEHSRDPAVSIIIPTYNRAATLMECLRALDGQGDSGVPFEVIVVDDGSTDDTLATIERTRNDFRLDLRVLRQRNQGPGVARNHGVEAARADLILFLGDDIVVESGHLAAMIRAYSDHNIGARGVLGHVRYRADCISTPFGRWLDRESPVQFDYRGLQPGMLLGFQHFYTANLLLPRDMIRRAGGFKPAFQSAAYEDTELGYRLAQGGLRLVYCPDASALHVHAVTFGQTRARMRAVGRAALELRTANPDLFALMHPNAERLIAHPSLPRRLVRLACARLLGDLVQVADERTGRRAPGRCYELVMSCTRSSEMARRWLSTSTSPGCN